jgi:hypothetical protein
MDDLELQLQDLVIFELPTYEDVEVFLDRLRPRWDGWSDAEEELWLFAAQLRHSRDLAPLLRETQRLAAELALPTIRYYVDGRVYVLEAAVDRAAA